MDVTLINPFLNAAMNVTKTMSSVDLILGGTPYLKENHVAQGDVTGIIGLTGDAKGSLAVSFNFRLVKTIMSNMLGEEIHELTDDAKDVVGELTNMISGDARSRLQGETGIDIRAAIPTVVAGENHTIKHITEDKILAIPFKSEGGGRASIELCVQNSNG